MTYYEKCLNTTTLMYPFYIYKLKEIQKILKKASHNRILKNKNHLRRIDLVKVNNNTKCSKCKIKYIYQLQNIIWDNCLIHKIEYHQRYPSEYFMKIILGTIIINNLIINPPLIIDKNMRSKIKYILLQYNHLLIIDALMKQGSFPRYENNDRYIYSEHSGVIKIDNDKVDEIIIATDTNRTDAKDNNIYLPHNNELFEKHSILFHTHPNTKILAGRMSEGIVYEFPSANDVFNFMKYYNEGTAIASIIIAPEGTYVIRPIKLIPEFTIDDILFYQLKNHILKLEESAVKTFKSKSDLHNPDIFHSIIGSDFTYIQQYNDFLSDYNIYVEYYPRIKKNGEWCLRDIYLQYIHRN